MVIRLVQRQTGDEPGLLLPARWPAGVFIEQRCEYMRVGNRIAVGDPHQVKAVCQRIGEPDADRAAGPEIDPVSDYGDVVRKGLAQYLVGGTVVDEQDGIGSPRLMPDRIERAIDCVAIVKGMDVS